ncbi:hypothetical protein [Merdibacter massiliensis]|nr:hypothetical protein [Merdibacter massiliensis]
MPVTVFAEDGDVTYSDENGDVQTINNPTLVQNITSMGANGQTT